MYAQSLIEILPGFSVSTFTSQQLSRWNLLQNESPDDTLYVMNPIDFTRMDSLGRFKMALPGGCPAVLCNATKRVSYPNGDYVVMADVLENDDPDGVCSTGDLSVVRHNGTAVGMIRVDDRAFEIRDLKDGKWCLRTVERAQPAFCPVESGNTSPLDEDTSVEFRTDYCRVQLLILFDQQANALNDIEQWARHDVERTNKALRNSRIFESQLMFEIIGFQEFNLPNPEEFRPIMDLRRIRDINQSLRNDLDADIVAYYTSTNYQVNRPNGTRRVNGAALGLVAINDDEVVVPERDAFMFVQKRGESRVAQTFEHEIAHLFQCQHETALGTSEFGRAHRFEHRSGIFGWGRKDVHTVVHNLVTDVTPIPHYSNPSVLYRNVPTGTETRNNARRLALNACEVANFRSGIDFSANIEGPLINCPYQFTYLKANVFGNATNPYSYVWETSTTSFQGPFTTIGGNSPILEFWLGEHGQTVYVRLTVSTANGLTTTVFYEVRPTYEANCFPFLQGETGRDDNKAVVSMHVWPNPARERINTALKVESPQDYIYADLLSSDGAILQSQQWKDVQAGTIYTWFQSTTLPPGIYRLRIVTQQGVVSSPVVKH